MGIVATVSDGNELGDIGDDRSIRNDEWLDILKFFFEQCRKGGPK
jgi:hypothetical protein